MTRFNWLHLTDLHQGMHQQGRRLPDVREAILRDIEERLLDQAGPWNLVLFTGDLTYSGQADQFNDLTQDFLKRLWDIFDKKQQGNVPKLLAVPGNHDLQWNDNGIVRTLIREWNDDSSDVQDNFWTGSNSEYRQVVTRAFEDYTGWWEELSDRYKPDGIQWGALPGDFSYSLPPVEDGFRIGILGLNTSFLQLNGGNFPDKLAIDIRQFNQACPRNPQNGRFQDRIDWIRKHHVCLLMTHHPLSWLHEQSQQTIKRSIMGAGFAVHLCGHMHEPNSEFIVERAPHLRIHYQGRSSFGLEECYIFRNNNRERENRPSYGYASGRIELLSSGQCELTIWPREVRELSTKVKAVPDHASFDLVDDSYIGPYDLPWNSDLPLNRADSPNVVINPNPNDSRNTNFQRCVSLISETLNLLDINPRVIERKKFLRLEYIIEKLNLNWVMIKNLGNSIDNIRAYEMHWRECSIELRAWLESVVLPEPDQSRPELAHLAEVCRRQIGSITNQYNVISTSIIRLTPSSEAIRAFKRGFKSMITNCQKLLDEIRINFPEIFDSFIPRVVEPCKEAYEILQQLSLS